jgi:hypothetical protein
MWSRIGVCSEGDVGDDRIWHAALSEDGCLALVFSWNEDCVLWDVFGSRVLCPIGPEYPVLEEWINPEGFVEVAEGPGQGRYRVFGLDHNYGKYECPELGIVVAVDQGQQAVLVDQRSTGEQVVALCYEAFSGDWAFCSLSDNCDVLAVIEPYYVTFFGRKSSSAGQTATADRAGMSAVPGDPAT